MALFESVIVTTGMGVFTLVRVPGGWVMWAVENACFIPFDKEFAEDPLEG